MSHESPHFFGRTRAFCLVLLLAVFVPVIVVDLRTLPEFLRPLACGAALVLAIVTFFNLRLAYFGLGLGLVLLGALSPGAINLLVLAFLFGYLGHCLSQSASSSTPNSAEPSRVFIAALCYYVLAKAITFVNSVRIDFDPLLLQSVIGAGGIPAVADYFLVNEPGILRSAQALIGTMLAALLALVVSLEPNRLDSRRLLAGVTYGVLLSMLFTELQLAHLHPAFLVNVGPFWQYVHRYAGTFTDPNAFGIMTVLLVPALIALYLSQRNIPQFTRVQRIFPLLMACLLLLFSLWSGSRTLWLGLFIYLVYLLLLLQRIKRISHKGIALTFSLVAAVLLGLGMPTVNQALQQWVPVPTAERVLRTLNWNEVETSLNSRVVFAATGWQMFVENVPYGVGLERFLERVEEYSALAAANLGGWRDNANNHYLQILAEEGLVGIILQLVAFFLFYLAIRFASAGERQPIVITKAFLVTLAIFLILLLTGPHLLFEEVRATVAVFLGSCVVARIASERKFTARAGEWISSPAMVCVVALFALVGAFFVNFEREASRGFYGLEQGERGADERVRWSGKQAKLVYCRTPQLNTVDVKALNPDILSDPLTVILRYRADAHRAAETRQIEITSNEWSSIELPMIESDAAPILEIAVERVWSPQSSGLPDPRWLGAMIRWPDEGC